MNSDPDITTRRLTHRDCDMIASAFAAQNWNKPAEQFERYLSECARGRRDILLAEVNAEFAGYLTVDWEPEYAFFQERSMPEIADLNVLIKFRKQGTGTRLLDEAERLISGRSGFAGIRVGLTADYGDAQRLYVKRGYVPDGRGFSQRGNLPKYGDTLIVDDDLTIAFTRSLR